MEEGIVAGGGTALVNIYQKVSEIKAEGDVETGVNIVLKALQAPVRQIAENAGNMLKRALVSMQQQMNGLIC